MSTTCLHRGNINLTIFDINEAHIKDNVMIGPNTTITTVDHPRSPEKRRRNLERQAKLK